MIQPYRLLIFLCALFSLKQSVFSQNYQMLVVDVDVTDIAYWETADRLVVCTNTDTIYGNSLLIINPYTGEIESSTFIGSIPRALNISHDQKWAYIGMFGANRVVRFDLETLTIDQTVFLGTEGSFINEAYKPHGIACSAESSNRFALIRGTANTPDVSHIVLYENGINQHLTGNSIRVKSLRFGDDEQLYGGNGAGLHKVSTSGPALTSDTYQIPSANFNTMHYLDGFMYSQNGFKIDVSNTPTAVHEFQIECSFNGRPYQMAPSDSLVFLVGDRVNAFGHHCMRITENFAPYNVVTEFLMSPRIDDVAKMLAWGNNGVALKLKYRIDTRYKLAIIRPCNYTLGISPVLTHEGIPGACYEELVTLTADSIYNNVFWSNGESGHQIHIPFNKSGDYFFQIADPNGCLSPPSNVLNVAFASQPDAPKIIPDVDTIDICTGEELVLRSSHGGFNENYWSDGSKSSTLTVDTAGLFALHVITREGCKQPVLDSIVVRQRPFIIPDQPILNPSNDTSLCHDESIMIYGPPGFMEYHWMVLDEEIITDVNTLFLSGTDHGITPVNLHVYDINGCNSVPSDNVVIRFMLPERAPTISRNENMLTASSSGTYKWFFNGNEMIGISEKTITVSEPGFYQVLKVGEACESDLSLPFNFE